MRETLRFLETMTLEPEKLDASRALAAGVSREALRDAAYVCAAFNVITRFADAIGAEPHSAVGLTREQAMAHEGRFFELGYA
jgi:alkylhydroperoxidase family enzyme